MNIGPTVTVSRGLDSGRATGAVFSQKVVAGLVVLADGLIVTLSGCLMYLWYVGWNESTVQMYVVAIAVNAIFTIGAFYFAGLYEFDAIADPYGQIFKIMGICGLVLLVLIAMAFALKVSAEFSRIWSFSAFAVETFFLWVIRAAFLHLIRAWAKAGMLTRRIAIIGAGEQGQRLADMLSKSDDPWSRVIGVFDDRADRVPKEVQTFPVLGGIDDLIRAARENRIDDILIALPWSAENRVGDIVERLRILPVDIRLCPDLIGMRYHNRDYARIGNVSYLNIFEKPVSEWNYVVKFLEDWILASIVLVLNLPLMAAIALAIKFTSRGPVLFRQKRYGFNNEVIEVYKFRTMYVERPPETGVPQATKDDPRVTSVGRFLRRTSLDELPQLFNVLQGTMSLVGPRPHAVEHNVEYSGIIQGYYSRHRVKPGITGWAQVNGYRGETDTPQKMEKRVEYDIYYIENWSLLFDLKIIFMTLYVVLAQKNAY